MLRLEDLMTTAVVDPVFLPASEKAQVQALHEMLSREGHARLVGKGGEPAIDLPDAVYGLLLRILARMQEGKAVSIVPVMQDLTTQQAAILLGVSRPYFVRILEAGKLPFHLTGTHRRVYLKDLMAYKRHRDHERHEALDRMGREAEHLGIYDQVLVPEQ
jgi:excisionase family DNA binding protein